MAKAPVFQHRHYKAIAALLDAIYGDPPRAESLIIRFCEMFERDNPRFDRARLIAAAQGKPTNGRDKVRS